MHRPKTWRSVFFIYLLQHHDFLTFSTEQFFFIFFYIFLWRDSENDLYKVDLSLETSSDFKYYFGFVVEKIFELGHNLDVLTFSAQ